jgi:hypothetical protein
MVYPIDLVDSVYIIEDINSDNMTKLRNIVTMVEGRKMLNVRVETWERLQSFGKFRESTDEVLNRLMDIAEEQLKKEKKK